MHINLLSFPQSHFSCNSKFIMSNAFFRSISRDLIFFFSVPKSSFQIRKFLSFLYFSFYFYYYFKYFWFRYMVGMKSKLNWEETKSNSPSISDIMTSILMKSGVVCMVSANKIQDIKKVSVNCNHFIFVTYPSRCIHRPASIHCSLHEPIVNRCWLNFYFTIIFVFLSST